EKAQDLMKRAQDLGDKQARLEHETREVRNILQPHAKELAQKVTPAEAAMQDAQQALRKNKDQVAKEMQTEATEKLREVSKNLDQLIAEAEKKANDPLAALQKAAETVEQLIKEQKDLKDKTQEAKDTKHEERLAPLSPRQNDLAKRTD